MNTRTLIPFVRDEELHAYIDGVLSSDRRTAIEAFLASHPEDAQRVEQYRTQNILLHRAFDEQAQEPLSAPLEELGRRLEEAGKRGSQSRFVFKGFAIAAGVAMIFATGWLGYGQFHSYVSAGANNPMTAFTRLAVEAHTLETGESSPPLIEQGVESGNALVGWLSQRVARTAQPAPDLMQFGLELSGGRIFLLDDRPVVHLVYRSSDHQSISLFLGVNQAVDNQDAFTYVQQGGLSTFYWRQSGMEFTVIGRMERDALVELAKAMYSQLRPQIRQGTEKEATATTAIRRQNDGVISPNSLIPSMGEAREPIAAGKAAP